MCHHGCRHGVPRPARQVRRLAFLVDPALEMSHPTKLPYTAQRVADLLGAMGHDGQVIMLPQSGKTSAEAAAGRGSVAQIAKSIVFRRISDDAPVMVIASGANRVDERKVEKVDRGDSQSRREFRQGADRLRDRRRLPDRPSGTCTDPRGPGPAAAPATVGGGRSPARGISFDASATAEDDGRGSGGCRLAEPRRITAAFQSIAESNRPTIRS